jgi:tetratricopeptide (TPR) repeat protein
MIGEEPMFKHAVFAVIAATLCLHPMAMSVSLAQDGESAEPREVTITGEQAELNDEAVRAIIGGDYATAVALLNESLLSVEANVIYLNLGKAYLGMGSCDKARESFKAALKAPVVESPAPEIVEKKVYSSLEELEEACADQPSESDTQIETADGKQANEAQPTKPAPVESTTTTSSQDTWGMSLIGAGVVLAGGGAGMHLVARSKRSDITDVPGGETVPVTQREASDIEDSANTFDTIGLSMAITGGVLAATGTYLWLTAPDETRATVSVGPTGDGWNVSWKLRF